jgi:multidrug efflux pump
LAVISRFFIDRPIFASVMSIIITLAGGIALVTLPVAQYPPISPPTVQVDCNFPGASAKDVAQAVAAPIEQQVNGVENMMYMSSQCTNDGSYNLTVTFKHGVNLNMAQVLVQNRVNLATPQLPDVIKATGVTTRKRSPDILLAIAITSRSGRYDQLYLSNYALMHVKEELARLPGVSDVMMMGQRDYSMRIWVDPELLAARNMMASDVVRALREQNMQVATGQIGQQPAPRGQEIQVPLSTLGRLVTIEQFENIIVKTGAEGRMVRLKDVARVELGAKNQDLSSQVNGRPCVSIAVFQLPDANALDTAVIVKDKIKELAADFPEGVDYEIRYDTTPYISESIGEVFKTLREAVILVALVVLVFLQNWRSAIIPLIAVPVAIIGTFAIMAAMGFSLNNLTLFGLVLAIGIVVDDAIVVVEAVEHHIEHGMTPRDATIRAMEEVSGPVIAIGLVLSAVFVPCAFITGITGQFFRQFALTIASSTIISAFNSLTLSPALAAVLLRPRQRGTYEALPRLAFLALFGWLGYVCGPVGFQWVAAKAGLSLAPMTTLTTRWLAPEAAAWAPGILWAFVGVGMGWALSYPLNWLLGKSFHVFNAGFDRATGLYTRTVGMVLRLGALVLVLYAGLLLLTYYEFSQTPKGFIPSQDMGYLLINVQLPDSAATERARAVMNQVEQIARSTPGVKHSQYTAGQSLLLSANGSNFGTMFVVLDEFAKRRAPHLRGEAIANKLRARFNTEVFDAKVSVYPPPPVRGVGRAGGFKIVLEDRGDLGLDVLQGQAENLAEVAVLPNPKSGKPDLVDLFSVFRANIPQLYVDVDRKECMTKGVPLKDLFDTLQIYLGSLYANDFNLFGRTWQVIVQADAKFRNRIEDAELLKVRNNEGNMVPLGTVANVRETVGPLMLTRYNMYPAAPINGNAARGISSGQAIDIMAALAKRELPPSMKFEWTEMAYLELQAGNTAMIVFAFAVVMVFLVLAAQYESWSLPMAVILVVPMCLLSAITGVIIAGEDINIFTQIGFVVLVGLASKNAILIVEFAKARREEGVSRRQAALDACKLRLRPIVMTSFAFILGVMPLLVGHGAGSEMRRTLGTTVFSGMLGVTLFGIFLTPLFFYLIDRLGESRFFSSPRMRLVGTILLGIFTLGIGLIRRFGRRTVRRIRPVRPARRPTVPAVTNGELVGEHVTQS